ncbi:hypothetical protein GALL_475560 [mine drainage metagenome]|uniref:Uncharacterized protein n=1 Tax=mine drainage metagenome TaxID=410659 RepID=A0A1J5PSX6_9ZZZZ
MPRAPNAAPTASSSTTQGSRIVSLGRLLEDALKARVLDAENPSDLLPVGILAHSQIHLDEQITVVTVGLYEVTADNLVAPLRHPGLG